jgi:hypothetical protein
VKHIQTHQSDETNMLCHVFLLFPKVPCSRPAKKPTRAREISDKSMKRFQGRSLTFLKPRYFVFVKSGQIRGTQRMYNVSPGAPSYYYFSETSWKCLRAAPDKKREDVVVIPICEQGPPNREVLFLAGFFWWWPWPQFSTFMQIASLLWDLWSNSMHTCRLHLDS